MSGDSAFSDGTLWHEDGKQYRLDPSSERPQLDDLEAIKERCRRATPGPWRWMEKEFNGTRRKRKIWNLLLLGPVKNIFDPPRSELHQFDYHSVIQLMYQRGSEHYLSAMRDEDRDFISQARTDVPALVAEVERLRRELEQRETKDA